MGKKIQVILLDRVIGLGQPADKVYVSRGYARNFLFPQQKAQLATTENLAALEQKLSQLRAQQEKIRAQAEADAIKIEQQSLTVLKHASDEGKLFGSVTISDVMRLVAEQCDVSLKKNHIKFPEGVRSLHAIGTYDVDIILHPEIQAKLQLMIQKDTDHS